MELEKRIEALERKLNQVVRQGIVCSVQPEKGTVTVKLDDSDGLVSKPLQVLFKRTVDNADYDMPDVGEQVVCIFLPNGMEHGFVIGSPYSSVDSVPVADRDIKHYRFADGSYLEYNRRTHHLDINISGTLDMFASGEMVIESGTHLQLVAPRIDEN